MPFASRDVERLSAFSQSKPKPVQVMLIYPGQGEGGARAAYARYCAAVGGSTFDGRPLPAFVELGERQKAGWCAAAGFDAADNPFLPTGGA